METFYTIEEKYLQAIDELNYGERSKALKLLNQIITEDPAYARAHYQLGLIYYYAIEDYQAAGYHLKKCAELEPDFPEVYEHYLRLAMFLGMDKLADTIALKALSIKGVNLAAINTSLGLFAEKKKEWNKAIAFYRTALLECTRKTEQDSLEEDVNRVKDKRRLEAKYNYLVS